MLNFLTLDYQRSFRQTPEHMGLEIGMIYEGTHACGHSSNVRTSIFCQGRVGFTPPDRPIHGRPRDLEQLAEVAD